MSILLYRVKYPNFFSLNFRLLGIETCQTGVKKSYPIKWILRGTFKFPLTPSLNSVKDISNPSLFLLMSNELYSARQELKRRILCDISQKSSWKYHDCKKANGMSHKQLLLTLSAPIEIIVSLYHQPTQLFFQLNDISRKQKT